MLRSRSLKGTLLDTVVFAVSMVSVAMGQGAEVSSQQRAVSLRQMAVMLANSGEAQGDARTVLAAAQLMITAERPSVGLERLGEPPPETMIRTELSGTPVSAASLLRLATRIAVEQQDAATAEVAARLAGDRDVGLGDHRLAEELERISMALGGIRGAAGGPVWADGYLRGTEEAVYRLTFVGGYVPNSITVSASNDAADLNCYLHEGETLVAQDDGPSSGCLIQWSQRFQGAVELRVRNAGADAYYVLISN